jgi:hypothetical protein
MRGVGFILAMVVCLAIFGLPIFGCFLGILGLVLGISVEVVVPMAMILTVAMVVGIGIKSFFIDD